MIQGIGLRENLQKTIDSLSHEIRGSCTFSLEAIHWMMCWLCNLQLKRNVEILRSDQLVFQVESKNSMDTAMYNESVVVRLVTRRVEARS